MIKRVTILLSLLLLGSVFLHMVVNYAPRTGLNPISEHYVTAGPDELGAANIVTAVLVTYRGLDTLGEVAVLFISAAGVGLLLRRRVGETEEGPNRRASSELVQTAVHFLLPLIFVLGIYVFINGHLTPGGGFQGGAVLASGIMLLLLADPDTRLNHGIVRLLESFSGFGYVVVGVLGLILAGGFLDNRFLDLGSFGELLSAGAMPIIYIFIGLKVGTELSAVLERMKD
ncbi:Na(+)/H(+) antiporter subunit B [Candidatus Thiosymbion oneisti]|uniref:Na(+)/H(+) antiporter subunit B n=1 Tax=Candidatus Thiosymbion oneisti TaxID=589554 RepID=UPI00106119E6|nr:Na(+)/H(+) antiporter subunit B [Candidatus Thiosymbion oneisti]